MVRGHRRVDGYTSGSVHSVESHAAVTSREDCRCHDVAGSWGHGAWWGDAHGHATEPSSCAAVGLLRAEDGQRQQEPGVPVHRPETPAFSARGPSVTLGWDVSSANPGAGGTFPECWCLAWPSPPRVTWPCGVGATSELGGTRHPSGFHRDHQTVVQLTNCHPVSEVPWGPPTRPRARPASVPTIGLVSLLLLGTLL